MTLRNVTVDIGELGWAYEDYGIDHRYFLDLETGEVLSLNDDMLPEVDAEEIESRIEAGLGTRYLAVPKTESSEGYNEMVDFIATIANANLKAILTVAVRGSGAFRRFKDVLLDFPEDREKWFAFKNSRTMARMEEWLQEQGIEVVWTGRL